MTLSKWVNDPEMWVLTPFFKGQKETPGSHFLSTRLPLEEGTEVANDF